MNDLRPIVAFAIAIALSFPDGSLKGCVALNVPIGETVATEISVPKTEIRDGTKYDNPLEEVILRAVTLVRNILASIEGQFARYRDKVLSLLASIEAPFVEPSSDNAADDTSRDRRRRWADHQLKDLSFDLSDVPNLLEGFVASIPNAITHPLEFASNMTSTAGGLAANGAGMVAQNGFNYLWKFLTTQGLPWMRTTLDKLDRSSMVPPSIHDFIKNFDAAYDLAKLLGYVQ